MRRVHQPGENTAGRGGVGRNGVQGVSRGLLGPCRPGAVHPGRPPTPPFFAPPGRSQLQRVCLRSQGSPPPDPAPPNSADGGPYRRLRPCARRPCWRRREGETEAARPQPGRPGGLAGCSDPPRAWPRPSGHAHKPSSNRSSCWAGAWSRGVAWSRVGVSLNLCFPGGAPSSAAISYPSTFWGFMV